MDIPAMAMDMALPRDTTPQGTVRINKIRLRSAVDVEKEWWVAGILMSSPYWKVATDEGPE